MAIITDDEVNKLIMSLANSRKEKGFTEDEMQQVYDWATQAVVDYAFLQLIYRGDGLIDIQDGQIMYAVTEEAKSRGVKRS